MGEGLDLTSFTSDEEPYGVAPDLPIKCATAKNRTGTHASTTAASPLNQTRIAAIVMSAKESRLTASQRRKKLDASR